MTIKERPFDKYYPYEIHDGWDGVIYATKEDLKNLQKEIKKTLTSRKTCDTIRVSRGEGRAVPTAEINRHLSLERGSRQVSSR